ncbi:hypothetical protein [Defluviimonas sp. SAOS-178_SWC]|uniref:hypothetical protein n=1 Tax=Defluviimonas sp. SAOS-178_SWC TaxID=3121287 RepID=UPI003221E75D
MRTDETTLIATLDALLRDEAEAIRRGNFTSLEALAARKTDLVGRLPDLPRRDADGALSRLRSRAEANQRLLSAAIEGVKAARARVEAIRRAGSRLDTYDSAGRAQSVTFGGGGVEKRA